ncbi:hypothetical protein C8Q74DRAFT_415195 [Fomes fomentarius]|nr:hypothetical protein C8Q74DRAFT_415195 [Fomes fomentarius]
MPDHPSKRYDLPYNLTMSNHSCFPTEVYESVIDAVYTDRTGSYGTFSTSCRTLRSCALVSRAWRPRSQRWLFHTVELSDATTLYKFAAGLEASPPLAGYVRVLHLIGHLLHNPRSVVALFPAMLMGKLPNLHSLSIIRVVEHGGRPVACLGSSEPTQCSTQKTMPYLPIHPRFPAVLSQFTAVNQLYLYSVSFPSFGTLFAPCLHSVTCATCDAHISTGLHLAVPLYALCARGRLGVSCLSFRSSRYLD